VIRVTSEFFSVRVEDSMDAVHLMLDGRFDAEAVPALDDAISTAWHRDVVLDLDGLTFMNGAAWLAVMACEHRVHDWGRNLRVANAGEDIRIIFQVTETDYLLSEGTGA